MDARSILDGRKHLEENMRTMIRALTLTLIGAAVGTAGAQPGALRRPVPPQPARAERAERADRVQERREFAADRRAARAAARRMMVVRRNALAARAGARAGLRAGFRAGMGPIGRGGAGPVMRGGRGVGIAPQGRMRMADRAGARRGVASDRIANLTPEQRNALRAHRDAARTERRRVGDAVRAGTMTREHSREQLRTWREQHRPPESLRRPPSGEGGEQ